MAFPAIAGPYRLVRELADGLLLVLDEAGNPVVAETVRPPVPRIPADPAVPRLLGLAGDLALQESVPGPRPEGARVESVVRLCRALERLHRATGGGLPRPGWAGDVVQGPDGGLRLRALGLRHRAGGDPIPEAVRLLGEAVGSPGFLWVLGRCRSGSYSGFGELADALERSVAGEPVRLEPVLERPLPPPPATRAPRRRRVRHALPVLLLVLLAGLGAWLLGHRGRLPALRSPAVYAGTSTGVAMLDAATGALRGRLPLDAPPLDLAVTPEGDRLLVLLPGRLLVLDTARGVQRGLLEVEPGAARLVTAPGGRALLLAPPGRLLLVRTTDPVRRERLLIEPGPVTACLGRWTLYLGARGRLRALRLPDLALQAEVRLPLAGPMAVEDDRVYVALSTGSVAAFDGPTLRAGPVLPGGAMAVLTAPHRVWTVSGSGRLREFDPDRGTIRREAEVGEDVSSALLVPSHRGLHAWLPLAERPALAVVDLDRGVRTGTLRRTRPLCFANPGGGGGRRR